MKNKGAVSFILPVQLNSIDMVLLTGKIVLLTGKTVLLTGKIVRSEEHTSELQSRSDLGGTVNR